MPSKTPSTQKEKSQTTKSANKNTKSTAPTKTTSKPSKSASFTSSQTSRTVKSALNSNNKQSCEIKARGCEEHKSIAEFIKMQALMNKYTKYAMSDKGKAEKFVRKHLKQANNKVWVEIIEIDAPKYYEIGYMQFKTVVCELYPRTTQPKYPPKSQYPDKDDYKLVCNAIEWETAQKDIRTQKRNGEKVVRYRIEGAVYLNAKDRPPMFVKSAPDYIKALANDVKDKSNSAWEEAYKYLNPEYMNYDEYKYKIRSIEKIE